MEISIPEAERELVEVQVASPGWVQVDRAMRALAALSEACGNHPYAAGLTLTYTSLIKPKVLHLMI